MEKIRVLICGGHVTPVLALIEKLQELKRYNIFYVGRINAFESDNVQAFEYTTIKKLHIPYFTLTTGRLQRYISFESFLSLFKIPIGIFQSFMYLWKIKPNIVVSFGGYVALPLSIVAWILKIPVITHEQTSVLGLANRVIGRFAQYMCLSWKQTHGVKKGMHTIVTGNLIRKTILSPLSDTITLFGDRGLPLLYITGGSLGSHTINNLVVPLIPRLVKSFRIIHQCGNAFNGTDYKKLFTIKNELPLKSKKNYKIFRHIREDKIGSILRSTHLVISRSGANSVQELAFFALPSILIPLPWSADNEQEHNARFLEDMGLGVVLNQNTITSEKLLETIITIYNKLEKMQNKREKLKNIIKEDAAEMIVQIIDTVVKSN